MRGEDVERVLFAGQRWCKVIAQAVAEDRSLFIDHAVIEDTKSLFAFLWKLLRARRLVRVGFRPGARTREGMLIDAITLMFVLRRGYDSVTMYWIGSDVQRAVHDFGNGLHTPFFALLQKVRHLAGHETLQESLSTIGVRSTVAHVPFTFPEPPSLSEQASPPLRMSVVTYIPDMRPGFYGSEMILDAARLFPGINFEVMGGIGSWLDPHLRPPNLHFLGWVADTRPVFLRASHVARLVEHDSLGGTVLEGLALGRRVLYTKRLRGTKYVAFNDFADLRSALFDELQAFRARGFELDRQGMAVAAELNRFDDNRRLIASFVCGRPPGYRVVS